MRRDHAVTRAAAAAAFAWAAVLALSVMPAHAHPTTDVTWNRDVGRILEYRCAACHHRSGTRSMDFTDYAQARQWSQAIKRSVLERRMPPWRPSPGFGDFANDRRLTSYEMEVIAAWVNGGTRIGPPVPSSMPLDAGHALAGAVEFAAAAAPVTSAARTIRISAAPQARWVSGWDFRPADASIIEHATLWIGSAIIAAWTPGEPATVLPAGMAYRVPAGTPLRAEVRYDDATPASVDQPRIALQFTARPDPEVSQLSLRPGTRRLTHAVEILSIRPTHASGGSSLQVMARRDDGSVEPLLVIDRSAAGSDGTYDIAVPFRCPRDRCGASRVDRAAGATLAYVTDAIPVRRAR